MSEYVANTQKQLQSLNALLVCKLRQLCFDLQTPPPHTASVRESPEPSHITDQFMLPSVLKKYHIIGHEHGEKPSKLGKGLHETFTITLVHRQ